MKISIARALNEIKLLNKRITKTAQSKVVNYKIGVNGKPQFSEVEPFKQVSDSLSALIARRSAIKQAIAEANAKTTIKVGAESMTIVEALAFKETLESQSAYLAGVQSNYNSIKRVVESKNETADESLNDILQRNFGKDKRADSSDYEAIAKPFKEANFAEIIDEKTLVEQIRAYEASLEDFSSEVDFALSEANAMTLIEIPE